MATDSLLGLLWHRVLNVLRGRAVPGTASACPPAAEPAGTAPVVPARAQVAPNDVFTPTRPRQGRRALVGREAELARILDGILDDQAHVVLYSERGRGKTSLSNLIIEQLRRRGAVVARCACEAETTFDTMMRALARDLPPSLLAVAQEDQGNEGCESLLPSRAIRPADVAAIPASLNSDVTVLVIDEFDRVTDAETRTRLADTIKLLSDRALRLYFIVVGVSDTLEQIIGQHPSIQRNILGVHLPLLRDEEIATMLTKGGRLAGIIFTPPVTRIVQDVARGMPYMAQLLGLRITQAALRRGGAQDQDIAVADADVAMSVQRLLDEAGSTVKLAYATLTAYAADQPDTTTLLRLARARQDSWGRMTVIHDINTTEVGGCALSTPQFQALLAAGVVAQPEGENGPAQFANRALIYHVLLLAAARDLAVLAGKHVSAVAEDANRVRQSA